VVGRSVNWKQIGETAGELEQDGWWIRLDDKELVRWSSVFVVKCQGLLLEKVDLVVVGYWVVEEKGNWSLLTK